MKVHMLILKIEYLILDILYLYLDIFSGIIVARGPDDYLRLWLRMAWVRGHTLSDTETQLPTVTF